MSPARILVIDNDQQAIQDIQSRLTRLGYQVIGNSTNSEEALSLSSKQKPDLILINTRLRAGNDGIKTGELIHSRNNIPIIYITTHTSQLTIRQASSTNPFGYIIKPFDDSQLFATIEIALTRYSLENQLLESKQWLNGVLMSIGEGVIAVDGTGSIRFINTIAEQITGWENNQAINKTLFEVFNIKDEFSGELMDLSAKLTELRDNGGSGVAIEAILISKGGSKVPVEIHLKPIFAKKDGFLGLVLSFRDVLAKRQAMEQIRQEASRAEALVQIAKQLNSQFDLKEVLGNVCSATNQIIKTSASMVFLLDVKSGIFKDFARKFEDNIPIAQTNPVNISFSRADLEKHLPEDASAFAISHVKLRRDIPFRNFLRLLRIQHLAIAPIVRNRELIGILICGSTNAREFSIEDMEFLTGLAEHITIAISNTRLFNHIRLGRERQRLLSKSIVDIQESERRRIARELHDHLGQALTGIQFTLESIKNQMVEPHRSDVVDLQDTVTDIISQVREMSLNLRPSMLDDLGLIPTLNWHLDRYTRQTGIHVNFDSTSFSGRFPEEIETTAYRIIQEALTNVARHAQVTEAFVGLAVDSRAVWLEILDKGRGFDTSAALNNPTSGLSGMSERAALAGGYLTINSYIDQGTQVVAALPLGKTPLERRENDRNSLSG